MKAELPARDWARATRQELKDYLTRGGMDPLRQERALKRIEDWAVRQCYTPEVHKRDASCWCEPRQLLGWGWGRWASIWLHHYSRDWPLVIAHAALDREACSVCREEGA